MELGDRGEPVSLALGQGAIAGLGASSPCSVLTELRAATLERHRVAEASLGILDRGLNLDIYRSTLVRLFSLYRPVESYLAQQTFWPNTGLELESRAKLPLLKRDLAALGIDTARLDPTDDICFFPFPQNRAEGFGCLYVFEGATLGGRVIANFLGARLGIDSRSGAAFFSSYGKQVPMKWRAFQMALLENVKRPAERAAAVASACHTFDAFSAWVRPSSLLIAER